MLWLLQGLLRPWGRKLVSSDPVPMTISTNTALEDDGNECKVHASYDMVGHPHAKHCPTPDRDRRDKPVLLPFIQQGNAHGPKTGDKLLAA